MDRRGFTLIELVVCLALVGGMLAVVTHLLLVVGRHCAQMTHRALDQAWPDYVLNQLRSDFNHAHTWNFNGEQLQLVIFSGVDPLGGIPEQSECLVTYRIKSSGDRKWLLRQWELSHAIDNHPPHVDLMAAGVRAFRLFAGGSSQSIQQASGQLPNYFEFQLIMADTSVLPNLRIAR
jgi:prepilin-type N-terminal cleavage/methylation domain-containing protein